MDWTQATHVLLYPCHTQSYYLQAPRVSPYTRLSILLITGVVSQPANPHKHHAIIIISPPIAPPLGLLHQRLPRPVSHHDASTTHDFCARCCGGGRRGPPHARAHFESHTVRKSEGGRGGREGMEGGRSTVCAICLLPTAVCMGFSS